MCPIFSKRLVQASAFRSRICILISETLGKCWQIFQPRREAPRLPTLKTLILNFCGVCWTKFETISSKIQMIKTIKKDSAERNNLSGGKDPPCLGCFPARRRGLGRNAGGISAGFFFLFANASVNTRVANKSTFSYCFIFLPCVYYSYHYEINKIANKI